MKKAFSTLCCLDYTLDEILELAVSCHMDAIELRVNDRMLDSIKDARKWGKKVHDAGIKVCDIASSIFISCQRRWCQRCQDLCRKNAYKHS